MKSQPFLNVKTTLLFFYCRMTIQAKNKNPEHHSYYKKILYRRCSGVRFYKFGLILQQFCLQ